MMGLDASSMRRRRTLQIPPAPQFKILVSGLQRLAFWVSVLLPLVYLPLLSTPVVLSGSLGEHELLGVSGLIAVNVLCLLIGHEYTP